MHVADGAAREAGVEDVGGHAQAVERDQRVAGGETSGAGGGAVVHGGQYGLAAGGREAHAQRGGGSGFGAQRDAEFFQPAREGQVVGAFDGAAQPTGEFVAADLADDFEHAVFGHADAGLAVALPQCAHDIVEAACAVAVDAQLQVECEGDEPAFGVVADDGVGGVFVLPVELGPRVEGGVGDALLESPTALEHAVERLRQLLEVGRRREHAAAHQREVVVIRGDAFKGPQQPGVALGAELVGHEGGGLDAFDVPAMKILVAAQAEKALVAGADFGHAAMGQVVARGEQRGRGAVFEPAVAVADDHGEEDVARHGRRAAEQVDLPLADACEVGTQARGVAVVPAGEDHIVGDAAGGEGGEGEVAHLDRVVDQRVVILGPVEAKAVARGGAVDAGGFGQCGGDTPLANGLPHRRTQVDQAGLLFLPLDREEQAGAVEEAVGLVQMRAAHRQIPCVDRVVELQRGALRHRAGLPARFVALLQRHRLSAGGGFEGDDVAREIADHVTAGNPRGERHALSIRLRPGNRAGHPKQMSRQIDGLDGVTHRWHGHGNPFTKRRA